MWDNIDNETKNDIKKDWERLISEVLSGKSRVEDPAKSESQEDINIKLGFEQC